MKPYERLKKFIMDNIYPLLTNKDIQLIEEEIKFIDSSLIQDDLDRKLYQMAEEVEEELDKINPKYHRLFYSLEDTNETKPGFFQSFSSSFSIAITIIFLFCVVSFGNLIEKGNSRGFKYISQDLINIKK